MPSRALLYPSWLAFVLIAAGVAWAQSPAPPGEPVGANAAGDYRIGPEDALDIVVWNNMAEYRGFPTSKFTDIPDCHAC